MTGNKYTRFDVQLPRVAGFTIKDVEDLKGLLIGFHNGHGYGNDTNVDPKDLRLVEDQIVHRTYTLQGGAIDKIAIRIGDHAVWNQQEIIHIVHSAGWNDEFTADKIPAALLQLVPVAIPNS